MRTINFTITDGRLAELKASYPAKGKNSDIGKIAVEIVRDYFLSVEGTTCFTTCTNGGDIVTCINGTETHYEVKGTESSDIAYSKLKVSSQHCHDALVNGMELIRVTNIGELTMQLHFMKHGEDFALVPEARWAVKKL